MSEKAEVKVVVVPAGAMDWETEAKRRIASLERYFRALPVPQTEYENWLVSELVRMIDKEKAAIVSLAQAGVAWIGRLEG